MWQCWLSGTLLQPLAEPVGDDGRKKEMEKTMRQRGKERWFQLKGPRCLQAHHIPSIPYTLMIASSMCVFVCVCLSLDKEPLIKWKCKEKEHCWIIHVYAFYVSVRPDCVWFILAVKCSIGTYRPQHTHTSKILMLALTQCFSHTHADTHTYTHRHSAVEAD